MSGAQAIVLSSDQRALIAAASRSRSDTVTSFHQLNRRFDRRVAGEILMLPFSPLFSLKRAFEICSFFISLAEKDRTCGLLEWIYIGMTVIITLPIGVVLLAPVEPLLSGRRAIEFNCYQNSSLLFRALTNYLNDPDLRPQHLKLLYQTLLIHSYYNQSRQLKTAGINQPEQYVALHRSPASMYAFPFPRVTVLELALIAYNHLSSYAPLDDLSSYAPLDVDLPLMPEVYFHDKHADNYCGEQCEAMKSCLLKLAIAFVKHGAELPEPTGKTMRLLYDQPKKVLQIYQVKYIIEGHLPVVGYAHQHHLANLVMAYLGAQASYQADQEFALFLEYQPNPRQVGNMMQNEQRQPLLSAVTEAEAYDLVIAVLSPYAIYIGRYLKAWSEHKDEQPWGASLRRLWRRNDRKRIATTVKNDIEAICQGGPDSDLISKFHQNISVLIDSVGIHKEDAASPYEQGYKPDFIGKPALIKQLIKLRKTISRDLSRYLQNPAQHIDAKAQMKIKTLENLVEKLVQERDQITGERDQIAGERDQMVIREEAAIQEAQAAREVSQKLTLKVRHLEADRSASQAQIKRLRLDSRAQQTQIAELKKAQAEDRINLKRELKENDVRYQMDLAKQKLEYQKAQAQRNVEIQAQFKALEARICMLQQTSPHASADFKSAHSSDSVLVTELSDQGTSFTAPVLQPLSR